MPDTTQFNLEEAVQCDKFAKKPFEYCNNCKGYGIYLYKGSAIRLICDYYFDIFLKNNKKDLIE